MPYCPVCKANRNPMCQHHTMEDVLKAVGYEGKGYKGKKPSEDD